MRSDKLDESDFRVGIFLIDSVHTGHNTLQGD